MHNWLNRTGLVLQFVALFLVTPEIFGEEKVRAATEHVIRPLVRTVAFLRRHPVIRSGGYVLLAVALLIGWIAVHIGISGSFTVILHGESVADVLLIVLVVLAFPYLLWRLSKLLAYLAGQLIDRAATVHRSFLPLGAGLFALGFVLLMAATFVP